MDIDTIEQLDEFEQENAKNLTGKKSILIIVDDDHPFDLNSYIAAYTGRNAVFRLLHIAERCPTLSHQALILALQRLSHLRDLTLYQFALSLYSSLGLNDPLPRVDDSWIQQRHSRNLSEKNKLEVELKTYLSNSIKESIRMAHRDLGDFYRDVGDPSTSLKHYTKSREFCSSSQHILDMCISVLELLIEQKNYSHLLTYVFKADTALEASTSSSSGQSSSTQGQKSVPQKKVSIASGSQHSPEKLKTQTKLDFASALAFMGQGAFDKAAQNFLKLGAPKMLGNWDGKVTTPSDIAIYGVLCALATYSRGAINSQILENETFGVYIEQEPYIRELVEAYMSSKFKIVLEILEKYSARHALDIHLYPFIHDIQSQILNRAIVLYFQPFSAIKMSRMSTAFGLSMEELERLLVKLIQEGDIKGRIDSLNKILKATELDQRDVLFAKTVKTGAEIQNANRKLLLRMRLQQADLIIKAPKKPRQQTADNNALGVAGVVFSPPPTAPA